MSVQENGPRGAPPPRNYKNQNKKKMDKRYYRLLSLLSLLYELQPKCRVKHSYKKELQERLSSRKYVELLDLLIRQMTILNRAYRLKEKGIYKSEKEDLVLALQLLERDIKLDTFVNPTMRLVYEQLQKKIGSHRLFTRTEVERITGYSKSSSSRLIRRLWSCGKLERLGGSRKTGYYYQLREE